PAGGPQRQDRESKHMSGHNSRKASAERGSDRPLEKGIAEKIAAAGLRAHGEMLACDIPAELPIIPLASTVVFPQMVVNLQVVRKKNLSLIRDMEQESIIGLLIQKRTSLEVTPIDELSGIRV